MDKQFIYFTGVLVLLMTAAAAVQAQENWASPTNITWNNTTLNATTNETLNATANETLNANSSERSSESHVETLNQTDLVSMPSNEENVSLQLPATSDRNIASNGTSLNATSPTLNQTIPAQSTTFPENSTVNSENNAPVIPGLSGSQATSSASSENIFFAIGSGLKSDQVFQINGNARPVRLFELGIPIKPVRDVGRMIFVCDIV